MQMDKCYSPKQLANTDQALKLLTVLPEDRQRTAAVMANVFLEGWMARDLFAPKSRPAQSVQGNA